MAMDREDVYEERIARFLELAEAAQAASERASSALLKVTYAKLASQWVELAQLATELLTTQMQISNTREDEAGEQRRPH